MPNAYFISIQQFKKKNRKKGIKKVFVHELFTELI